MSKSFVWGAVSVLAALIIGAAISYFVSKAHFRAILDTFSPRVDTLYLKDTTKHLRPISMGSPIFTGEMVKIPSYLFFTDTLYRDSTALAQLPDSISLPREQEVYSDSTYKAWVSGVSPRLDSIYVFPTTKIITKTLSVPEIRKQRVTFSIQGGVGVVQPFGEPFKPKVGYYVGAGLSWNF